MTVAVVSSSNSVLGRANFSVYNGRDTTPAASLFLASPLFDSPGGPITGAFDVFGSATGAGLGVVSGSLSPSPGAAIGVALGSLPPPPGSAIGVFGTGSDIGVVPGSLPPPPGSPGGFPPPPGSCAVGPPGSCGTGGSLPPSGSLGSSGPPIGDAVGASHQLGYSFFLEIVPCASISSCDISSLTLCW